MLGGAALALAWVLLPLGGAILWAVVIALLFRPLQQRLQARLGGRATPAATVTLALVLVIVVLPLAFILLSLARELMALVQRLQSGELDPTLYVHGVFDALPGWSRSLLRRAGMGNFKTLQTEFSAAVVRLSQLMAGRAFGFGQDTFDLALSLFVTLYLSFFFLRDGDRLAQLVRHALPLAPAHRTALIGRFCTVIRATVKGNLLVAAAQGALGGLALWWLGVGAAILWAVVMAFLSLLPAVGAALVWLPVAVWLLVNGQLWQGLALIGYGVLVIGLVDNLLRPLLVGKDTGLPDYVVMTTTLGGLAVFGLNGFILGPTVAAMAIAVWHLALEITAQDGRHGDAAAAQAGAAPLQAAETRPTRIAAAHVAQPTDPAPRAG
jgi:predicted PurR-regulated permease PerM